MWLLALPFPRLGSRSSVNARMLFGAQQPVQLEQLTLGLGSVVAGGVHMPCQHSAFALPRAVPAAPLVLAEPLDATSALLNAAELAGAAVLIRRGGCSFEEKLRRASECEAAAVILIDDQPAGDDTPVLARPDRPTQPPTAGPGEPASPAYCPLVSVSAASGEALLRMAQGAGTAATAAAAAGGEGAGGEGAATCEVLPYPVERVDWHERSELLQAPRYLLLLTTYYLLL